MSGPVVGDSVADRSVGDRLAGWLLRRLVLCSADTVRRLC